jgi:CRP/FNR family transcriptional regulator, cyclic AMP receptor protein
VSDSIPGTVDLLGYCAGGLVLLAFSLRSVVSLRTVAIASNLMFIAYGLGAHVPPVLVLHVALLPVNGWRLWQCMRAQLSRSNGVGPTRQWQEGSEMSRSYRLPPRGPI